jgi:hypothetical protein
VAREFGWYASKCFVQFTPYFYIQMAHAGQIARGLPHPITLGRLKNERKYREAKNMHSAQGASCGGPSARIRGVSPNLCLYLII